MTSLYSGAFILCTFYCLTAMDGARELPTTFTTNVENNGSELGQPQSENVQLSITEIINCIDEDALRNVRKIGNILFIIKEIKAMHDGFYRVNAQGEPDLSRDTSVKGCIFRGKKQTLKELLALEGQADSFSASEKNEFNALLVAQKAFFHKISSVFSPDGPGRYSYMDQVIEDFCLRHNCVNSLLLNWLKEDTNEFFRKKLTSFTILHRLSTDLLNFLADLVKRCPRAFNAYKESIRRDVDQVLPFI